MSTGSVTPFTPIQELINSGTVLVGIASTIAITANTTSQTETIEPADAVMIYNAGTVPVFVATGAQNETVTAIGGGSNPCSTPVPPGAQMLIGTPGVAGGNSNPITQIGVITATSTAQVYITPGLGTQH